MAMTGMWGSGAKAASKAVAGALRPTQTSRGKRDEKAARSHGGGQVRTRDPRTGRFVKATPLPDWVQEFQNTEPKVRVIYREKPIPWLYWYVWIMATAVAVAVAYATGQMSIAP